MSQCCFWFTLKAPVPLHNGQALSSAAKTASRMNLERFSMPLIASKRALSALNVIISVFFFICQKNGLCAARHWRVHLCSRPSRCGEANSRGGSGRSCPRLGRGCDLPAVLQVQTGRQLRITVGSHSPVANKTRQNTQLSGQPVNICRARFFSTALFNTLYYIISSKFSTSIEIGGLHDQEIIALRLRTWLTALLIEMRDPVARATSTSGSG